VQYIENAKPLIIESLYAAFSKYSVY